MNSFRAPKITGLVVVLALFPAGLHGAAQQFPANSVAPGPAPAQVEAPAPAPAAAPAPPQQIPAPSEGQALHILVGKSVVVNVQAPITRVLSSNPTVIETLATSPTEIVVEGRAPGTSNLILWDQSGHSQMLDVMVDLDVSALRTSLQ